MSELFDNEVVWVGAGVISQTWKCNVWFWLIILFFLLHEAAILCSIASGVWTVIGDMFELDCWILTPIFFLKYLLEAAIVYGIIRWVNLWSMKLDGLHLVNDHYFHWYIYIYFFLHDTLPLWSVVWGEWIGGTWYWKGNSWSGFAELLMECCFLTDRILLFFLLSRFLLVR